MAYLISQGVSELGSEYGSLTVDVWGHVRWLRPPRHPRNRRPGVLDLVQHQSSSGWGTACQ